VSDKAQFNSPDSNRAPQDVGAYRRASHPCARVGLFATNIKHYIFFRFL
jgi:hypothetical protein